MMITSGKHSDEASIRKLWDECFDEDSIEWRDWYFNNIFKIDNVIGSKQKGELLSMVHMNPYPMIMRKSEIKAFALAGVATKEMHRGQGYAGKLIKHALNKAYKLGCDFSFLEPFEYKFYEKFGYSIGYNKFKYDYKYLPGNKTSRISIYDNYDSMMLAKIYSKFTENKNGYVLRDKTYFDIHLKELFCDNNNVICFSIDNNLGYFCINEKKTTIEEMAYEGNVSEAIKEIVNYFKCDITFENLYDLPDMISIKEPHCMGRVISVEGIFKKVKCKDININIKIKDNIINENNYTWSIKSLGGKTQITKVDEKEDYVIDISRLTPILTGMNIKDNKTAKEIQNLLFKNTNAFIYELC